MFPAETQYFTLLRAALWDKPVDNVSDVDWKSVMKMAVHHGNNVLLSDVAVRMEGKGKPSEKMLSRMQSYLRGNLLSQMRLRQILSSAVSLLREHKIEPVVLKGFGLALLYPNPSLRQFGDVDLFVGLDHFHEACDLLRTLPGGYNWGNRVDSGKHFNIEFGEYPMEIHRVSAEVNDPKGAKTYAAIERDGLYNNPQRVDMEGLEISLPSKEFMVFFTFFHAWHHFLTSGVGWRQISDVAMALHAYHGQLDLEKLRQWLTEMQLMKPWQVFGYLMVEYLGLPQTEMPFYEAKSHRTAQRLYCNVTQTGNFRRNSRFKQRHPKNKWMHKLHSFIGVFVDFLYRARVFPSEAFREMRHSFGMALKKMGK